MFHGTVGCSIGEFFPKCELPHTSRLTGLRFSCAWADRPSESTLGEPGPRGRISRNLDYYDAAAIMRQVGVLPDQKK
jgi:hypothetical protein